MSDNSRQKDFATTQSCTMKKGTLSRSGHVYKLTYPYHGAIAVANYDFTAHPMRSLLVKYIFNNADELAAGSVNHKMGSMAVLAEYLRSACENDISPRVFTGFVNWLETCKKGGRRRYGAATAVGHATRCIELYKFGVDTGHLAWSQRDLDIIKATADRLLREIRQRNVNTSIDKAISDQTYLDLLKAISLECEQCKDVIEERDAGLRSSLYDLDAVGKKRLDPNPFIVLGGLAALLHGVRACEFNMFTHGDLRVDPSGTNHELYLHAPNKADAFIPVDDALVDAWRLCQQWDKEARLHVGEKGTSKADSPFVHLGRVYLRDVTTIRLTTAQLNRCMRHFYMKWFTRKVRGRDGDERPLLHADGDPTRPLRCSFSKLRNAFAVQFADREKNRALLMAAMRHTRESTAEQYYLHRTRLDHAQKVHRALQSEARALVMSLKNPLAAGVTDDTLSNAKAAGADLPHGFCGPALNDDTCVRASGCLECPHLVVIASRKSRFVADRDAYLKRAEELHLKGDTRGAENFLSRAKLCQAHILRIEDKYERGTQQ